MNCEAWSASIGTKHARRETPGNTRWVKMTEDLLSEARIPMRYAPAPAAVAHIPISATIALVVSVALAVIAASIGIVQAETLSAMVEDEVGRLALFVLIVCIVIAGCITAVIMWLTAPTPVRNMARMQPASFRRTSATSF